MLLRLLNKYRYEIKCNKTNLYKFINDYSSKLKERGYLLEVKKPTDLFKSEVIVNSYLNEEKIKDAYYRFNNTNYDIIQYINYDEKRMMLQRDMVITLDEIDSFVDSKTNTKIYIAYYEPFINERIRDNYLMLTLKQHSLYLKQSNKNINYFNELYGLQPYNSSLSSLKVIGQDDEYQYYYHSEFKTIYLYNKKDGSYHNELCFIDASNKIEPSIEDIKEVLEVFLSNNDDNNFIELLLNKQFISNKTYNKILKKIS